MTDWHITEPSGQQQWQAYYHFRWQQLRQPWQQPQGSERDELEATSTHRIALCGQQIIGVGRLHLLDSHTAQIRYMAVAPKQQRQGIGRALLHALETTLSDTQVQTICLHSRESAVGFYERQGYRKLQPSHCLYGKIQHYLMQKSRSGFSPEGCP